MMMTIYNDDGDRICSAPYYIVIFVLIHFFSFSFVFISFAVFFVLVLVLPFIY